MRTLVIAEGGSNHDGKIAQALRLVDVAKDCGADCVKFQFWSSAERLAERRHAPEYLEIYRRYQMPREWLPILKAHCDTIGNEFMCTTYLPEDVHVIAPFVDRFKVASFEAGDRHFVRLHREFSKPVVISLGMGVDHVLLPLQPRDALLHCVSAYPTPPNEANVNVVASLRHYYGSGAISVGLSDHTGDPLCLSGAFAVCAGATIVEVHFVIPDTDPANPDAGSFALSPIQLRTYIGNIRHAELLLGDGEKRVQECEIPMQKFRVVA